MVGTEAGSPAASQENEPSLFNPATIREFTPTFDINSAVRAWNSGVTRFITHLDRRRQTVHLKTVGFPTTPSRCHP